MQVQLLTTVEESHDESIDQYVEAMVSLVVWEWVLRNEALFDNNHYTVLLNSYTCNG